jgi:iron complex outermembrane recepter protein
MFRFVGSLIALALVLAGQGQSCFKVIDAVDRKPVVNCMAFCADGSLAGTSDALGRICVLVPCSRFELRSADHVTITTSLSEALLVGEVELPPHTVELRAVEVEPWPRTQDRQALAAVSVIDSALLTTFERSSLRSAAQTSPGVQWDQRGLGGSQRLSIRGSLIRSPFGVRGVKVYWGPFPLTLADGSTPLELLDPQVVGSLEVIRSIGSPVFGSAPSGLLLAAAPFRSAPGRDLGIEVTGGSYGFYRAGIMARSTDEQNALAVGLLRQRNDGYRQQEWSARDQAFITSRLRHKRGHTQLFLTWQNASWALPGSLDSLTATNEPQRARAYSQAINAHIEKQQLMGGMATELALGKRIRVRSGIHAQLIDKKNPYGTSVALSGYKTETIRAAGARLTLSGDRLLGRAPIAWELGLEALLERDRLEENTYANAVYGELRVNGDSRIGNLNAFAMTTTKLCARTLFHAGLGVERTSYRHTDLLADSQQRLGTEARPTPLLGVEYALTGYSRLHVRYAQSVNRPTMGELLGSAGLFNTGLRGEEASELEAGIRLGSDTLPVCVSLNAYARRSRLPINALQSEASTVYVNAGMAEQNGVEVTVEAETSKQRSWRAYALGTATVQENSVAGATGKTQEAPGIPRYAASLLIRLTHRRGHFFEAGWRGRSSIRAAFDQPALISGSNIFQARIGWRTGAAAWSPQLFLHVDNVFDANYTSWVQVNDPGGRYYNPAPGRSVLGGVKLTFGRSPRATKN